MRTKHFFHSRPRLVFGFALAVVFNIASLLKDAITDSHQERQMMVVTQSAPPFFPEKFSLDPVVDVILPKNSMFLSCVNSPEDDSTDLYCVYRHNNDVKLRPIVVDGKTFRVKSRGDWELPGEDPRTFVWNNEVFVMDNCMGHPLLHLRKTNKGLGEVIDFFPGQRYLTGNPNIPRPSIPEILHSKNTVPIPINNTHIMFMDIQNENIHICTSAASSNPISIVLETARKWNQVSLDCSPLKTNIKYSYVTDDTENTINDWNHRGGTPGVEISNGVYAGFGHATHKKWHPKTNPHHDIFFWRLDFTRDSMGIMEVRHVMTDHHLDHKLTDPVSFFYVDGGWYLITAESDEAWQRDIMYSNRVYQINPLL